MSDAAASVPRDIRMENFSISELIKVPCLYGVVGRNGTGKTTHMAMHAIAKNSQILHVEQDFSAPILSALAYWKRKQAWCARWSEAAIVTSCRPVKGAAPSDDKDTSWLAQVYKRLEQMDAYTAEARAASILAGGFIGSWLVKLLLENGHTVRATVRNELSMSRLQQVATESSASSRLQIVGADMVDYPSVEAAVSSHCRDGVFHVACAMGSTARDNPHREVVQPIIDGTLNLMRAAKSANVKRVVITGTIGTMHLFPNRRPDALLDEACWSDPCFMEEKHEWYCLGKTLAERAAWEYAARHRMDLVVLHPSVVLGPVLHTADTTADTATSSYKPNINVSNQHILRLLQRRFRYYLNEVQAYVDVRDVALAHVRALECQNAAGGRYLCAESSVHREHLVEELRSLYPEYPLPTKCLLGSTGKKALPFKLSTQKICTDLGIKFRPLRECLKDSVESFKDKGFL